MSQGIRLNKPKTMTISGHLASLESMDFIQVVSVGSDVEYKFRHTLLQEAAYRSLLRDDRRHLHRAAGEALERIFSENLEEKAAILARHFAEAGDQVKTLRYLQMAGDHAANIYANQEAVGYYARAVAIIRQFLDAAPESLPPGWEERLKEISLMMGRALEHLGSYQEAEKTYHTLVDIAQQHRVPQVEMAGLLAHLSLHSFPNPLFDFDKGNQLAEAALRLADDIDDRDAKARIYWNLMQLNFFKTRMAEALEWGEKSIAEARLSGKKETLAMALNDISSYGYMTNGMFAQALAALEEALVLLREQGNMPMVADNLSTTAFITMEIGDLSLAKRMGEEAYHITSKIGNVWGKAYSLGVAGSISLQQGEIGSVLAHLREGLEASEQVGFIPGTVIMRTLLSRLLSSLELHDQAIQYSREALRIAEEQVRFWLPQTLGSLAFSLARSGQIDEAELYTARAREVGLFPSLYPYQVIIFLAEAEIGLRRGNWPQVVALMEGLAERSQRNKNLVNLVLAHFYTGRAYFLMAEFVKAAEPFSQAASISNQHGIRFVELESLAYLYQCEAQMRDPAAAETRRKAASVADWIASTTDQAELRQALFNLPHIRKLFEP